MSHKKYRRKLDPAERAWLALAQQGSPMAFVLIIEGIGDISNKAMENALREVSILYPVCHSKISGCLKTLRWEESDNFPRFIRMGSTTFPFSEWPLEEEKRIFQEKIDPRKESPVAVYSLTDGQKCRLYFKIHHSSMDGMGIYLLANDFFKILRGEKPAGPTEGPETKKELYDITLPKDFFEKMRQELLKNKKLKSTTQEKEGGSILFNGMYEGRHMISPPSKDNQVEWCSLLIPSDEINLSKLNAKIISAVMEVLDQLNPGLRNKRFQSLIPVDLRYLFPGLRKASNLTGVIAVELDKYFDAPFRERVLYINDDIKKQIQDGWALSKLSAIYDWSPIRLMSILTFIFRKIAFYRKKYPYYFLFSNEGRWDLSNLSAETFRTHRAFVIPIMQICCPLFILMTTHEGGVELLCVTDTDKEGFAVFMNLLKEELLSLEKELEAQKD